MMRNNFSKLHNVWSLCVFLILCFVVEILRAYFISHSVQTWYPTLLKPEWTPPTWLFSPIWTLLYAMTAVAGWLVYIQPSSKSRTTGLIFFAIQLVLNLSWSYFFFTRESPLLGLVNICLLWTTILITWICFYKASRLAALLWLPYTLWTTYATILNATIYYLNR